MAVVARLPELRTLCQTRKGRIHSILGTLPSSRVYENEQPLYAYVRSKFEIGHLYSPD